MVPAGFASDGLPVGITFLGLWCILVLMLQEPCLETLIVPQLRSLGSHAVDELLNASRKAVFASHPPAALLRTTPIASKPASIRPFLAFYQIGSPVGKWKSGVRRSCSRPRTRASCVRPHQDHHSDRPALPGAHPRHGRSASPSMHRPSPTTASRRRNSSAENLKDRRFTSPSLLGDSNCGQGQRQGFRIRLERPARRFNIESCVNLRRVEIEMAKHAPYGRQIHARNGHSASNCAAQVMNRYVGQTGIPAESPPSAFNLN